MTYNIVYEVRYFNRHGFKYHTKSFDCNHEAERFFQLNTEIAGKLVDKVQDTDHGLPTYIDNIAIDDRTGESFATVASWTHKSHEFPNTWHEFFNG
ncbi:MAG: hypothetical protein OSA23_08965 [Rhodospirillales bacterium]|nr:hypothetical protein [Rhodospirillales bacterium]